jgi:putative Mg2+ transporter-C (MgtC) family protein
VLSVPSLVASFPAQWSWQSLLTGHEKEMLIRLGVALVCALLIGGERELRGKAAGISTQALVIGGAATFTFAALLLAPADPTRIAAQVVSGVGFLGAGLIMRTELPGEVTNLTTAASVWFAASVGMLIGFGWFTLALMATAYAVCVPRIPRVARPHPGADRPTKPSQR